jgi:hypothetical protein
VWQLSSAKTQSQDYGQSLTRKLLSTTAAEQLAPWRAPNLQMFRYLVLVYQITTVKLASLKRLWGLNPSGCSRKISSVKPSIFLAAVVIILP